MLFLIKNENDIHFIFQADIKPVTDGCNGLKYNLTQDIIASIFKTYPMGKKFLLHVNVHEDNVAGQWYRDV